MDVFSRSVRSAVMRRVGSINTRPEVAVRKIAHALGVRYRLHCHNVPGRPDLAIVSKKQAVFVHGCFWHRHTCEAASLPKSNTQYWTEKQQRNSSRDKKNIRRLRRDGWRVLVIWECEIKNVDRLRKTLKMFFTR